MAGIQQLLSRSAIKQETPHLGKPAFLTAYGMPLATERRKNTKNNPTPSCFRQKCAKSISLQGAIQSESIIRKPRHNGLFRSATAKPVIVSQLSSARLHRSGRPSFTSRMVRNNHGAGLLEDSPTRASPGPPGAPSCALFRSLVPGPGQSCHPVFGQCAMAPPPTDFLSCTHAGDDG